MSLLKLQFKKTRVELTAPSALTCPVESYDIPENLKGARLAMAKLYKNYGAVIDEQCGIHKIETAAALAVMHIEAGGVGAYDAKTGLAVIRVEARRPILSRVRFPGGELEFKEKYGRGQVAEWKALSEWFSLEGENACYWTSFGLGQIMGFNYELVHCRNPIEVMVRAQSSAEESAKMFFDFVNSKKASPALRSKDWLAFARVYNGSSNAKAYAKRIGDSYELAVSVLKTKS